MDQLVQAFNHLRKIGEDEYGFRLTGKRKPAHEENMFQIAMMVSLKYHFKPKNRVLGGLIGKQHNSISKQLKRHQDFLSTEPDYISIFKHFSRELEEHYAIFTPEEVDVQEAKQLIDKALDI